MLPYERSFLLLLEQPNKLLVLADPNWRQLVLPVDRDFLENILADFRDRAGTDPAGLFAQASQLNFGPLLTQETGFIDANTIHIAELRIRFVPL